MAAPWESETALTLDEARQLIIQQFPDLAGAEVEPAGEGWDNVNFLVNGTWIFRFPRIEKSATLIETEIAVLPAISRELSMPIPVPVRLGSAGPGYPFPFLGYRFLPGKPACRLPLTATDRKRLARPIGKFLRELHGIKFDDETARSVPTDTLGRTDVRQRVAALVDRLSELMEMADGFDSAQVRDVLGRLHDTEPWQGAPVAVHGDLYSCHLLLDETRRLCGVVDWGDVHHGDPAVDLSILFSFLSPPSRFELLDEYGGCDPATLDRARFRGINYGINLWLYGLSIADSDLANAGRFALSNSVIYGVPGS